jgi:hypothetical protein
MPPQHMGQQQGSADGVHLCAGKFHCAISIHLNFDEIYRSARWRSFQLREIENFRVLQGEISR